MARIVLDNVSVDFPIYGAHQRSLRSAIAKRATGGLIQRDGRHQDRVVVRALSNVSMILEEGDRIGLIGHNGSGKSTLLKVLAGIYEPVQGSLTVEGRVTPLFDMMPGLDLEDTGYENLFTAGLLLGMSRDTVESKIAEIEEFSELGEYLSLPVRTYSAGMTTRLGFALITALNPDILIMDEGFGAADLRFTEKAAERMDDFIGRSRIMVLASHSDGMLQQICNKAALMNEGQLVEVGPVEQMLELYRDIVHERTKPVRKPAEEKDTETLPPDYHQLELDAPKISQIPLFERDDRRGDGRFRFLSVVCRFDEINNEITIRADVLNRDLLPIKNIRIAAGIDSSEMNRVSTADFSDLQGQSIELRVGITHFEISMQAGDMNDGAYYVTVFGSHSGEIADWVRLASAFLVERKGESRSVGSVDAQACKLRILS